MSSRSSARSIARIGVDARARGLDRVLAERELVEQDRLLPADLAHLEEELERLDQVDGADGEVVVPLAPVVVDLDREQTAVLVHERQRVRRGLLGEQRVPEVDDDADVVAPERLDAEQRARRGREDRCVRGSLALYSIATRIASSISATVRTPSSASFHSSR